MELEKLFRVRYEEKIKPDLHSASALCEAVEYSLLNQPGKRIRPKLITSIWVDCGNDQYNQVLSSCLALEMLHIASLIHDDLPALDNDDLRRGQPTCHVKFNEATAVLAGDVLPSLALKLVLEDEALSFETRLKVATALSRAYADVCKGQQLDMDGATSWEQLKNIHTLKTGALFSAAFYISGVHLGFEKEKLEQLYNLGTLFGLWFQVRDDLRDYKNEKEGRTGSDIRNNKKTSVSILGLLESQKVLSALENQIITTTERVFETKTYSSLAKLRDIYKDVGLTSS